MAIDQKDIPLPHEPAPAFGAGWVGERHDSYQHRTRVRRQMRGQLAALREREATGS
ncbi:hypothetical protein [Sphingomonas pituitosa]|uniref:hypothetical protein n=1 Tax=Sphingomonas pituitosa TaxID=99597 RepID=UPI000A4D25E3|nr:hypothetical protein [Sphingomonas pituitosa]